MNNSESLNTAVYSAAGAASMFSSLLPFVGAGLMAYSMFTSAKAAKEQKKQQRALADAQIKQANLLREKIKADNAGLYSSVQSSISQKSGPMGAVY